MELVENILRDLNFIPCKELTALNLHIKKCIVAKDFDSTKRFLNFLFEILPINIYIKDAYRELFILETFLSIVQICSTGKNIFKKYIFNNLWD